MDTIKACRDLLRDITPLKTDCGRVCGGACCHSQEGEETGMLLFPGEEKLYDGIPGYRVTQAENGLLLICNGTCDREARPLSCRIFPLLPVVRGDKIKVAMDARAKAVCPLQRQGVSGLSSAFVEAVRACGQLLAADETQREMLLRLTKEHDELKTLQAAFGGR